MMAPRMRLVRFAPLLLGIAFALPAAAQITEPPVSDGTLTLQLVSQNSNGTDYTLLNSMQRQEFFNLAHCQCQSQVFVRTTLVPVSPVSSDPVHFWVGQNCDTTDLTQRPTTCAAFPGLDKKIADFIPDNQPIPFTANQLMFPLAQQSCPQQTGNSNTVWAFIDRSGDSIPDMGGDFKLTDETGTTFLPVSFDTQPPSAVQSPSVVGVDNGFKVSWTVNNGDVSDLRGYQVLCLSQKTRKALFHTRKSDPEYVRAQDVDGCTPITGVTPDGGVAADAGTSGGDAGTDDETAFQLLDPKFICAGFQQGGSSNGVRIDLGDGTDIDEGGADEGILVKIVAIDMARNGGSADAETDSPPVPAIDAWNYYHEQNGQAEGGYCFVATAAYGDYDHPYVKVLRRFRDETLAPTGWGRDFIAWYYAHSPPWADFLRAHPVARVTAAILLFPVVVVAAVWNAAGVVGLLTLVLGIYAIVRWRRRRVVRLAAAAVALVAIVGIGGRAHAQSWLDEEEMQNEPTGPKPPNWAFEIKLGPYFPNIDDEAGLKGKPYATTFGSGSSLLAQIELDHYFFHPLGELGIGISAGYMSNGANAFIQASDADGNPLPMPKCTDNTSMCRSADSTDFTMYPLALLAVYRFTMIADRSVVPLVPYAKLGLSYYIWRMTNFTGGTSSFNGNDAAGGTLGWQGTIGISIRAERLDPESARALSSDLGVDHIGFFAELTFADVSGLGMDKKLHVGDTTWAAGLNFEF